MIGSGGARARVLFSLILKKKEGKYSGLHKFRAMRYIGVSVIIQPTGGGLKRTKKKPKTQNQPPLQIEVTVWYTFRTMRDDETPLPGILAAAPPLGEAKRSCDAVARKNRKKTKKTPSSAVDLLLLPFSVTHIMYTT